MLGSMELRSFSRRPGEGLGTVDERQRAAEAIEARVGFALGREMLEKAPRLSKPHHGRELVSLPADARPWLTAENEENPWEWKAAPPRGRESSARGTFPSR